MTLSTKGFLQYTIGGICLVAGLLLAIPLAADFWFGWRFAAHFESDGTFTIWDAVNMGAHGFAIYFVLALFGGTILAKLGYLLLMWGSRNMKLAEGRRP